MSPPKIDELQGIEYDWLACDRDGHVALFSTAGWGCAPVGFVDDTGAHDRGVDALLQRSASTSARESPVLPRHLVNTWHLVAERGVFAFDFDVDRGIYRRVAVPDTATLLGDVPEVTSKAARTCTLSAVAFDEVELITCEQICG